MSKWPLLKQVAADAEAQLVTPGNVHRKAGRTKEHLMQTSEFQMIRKNDPDLADTLVRAWDGDNRDAARQPDKRLDGLFPKIIDLDYLKRAFPGIFSAPLSVNIHTIMRGLKILYDFSFSSLTPTSTRTDGGIWSQEKWAREGEENGDSSESDVAL
jgi:hypothetical protein